MNKDKVYLEGYVVGHAADTLGYQGLMVQLENLDVVEIDKNLVHKDINKPQKVIVPQFVADWYEDIVDEFYVVLERLVLNYKNNTDMPICKWFFETEDALTILINMHQFGYTVEKEKRYLVKMKGIDTNFNFLNRHRNENHWIFSSKEKNTLYQTHHTRDELENAGFGWVFDCPGIEIEEAKG